MEGNFGNFTPILLGRPFLNTSKTKIDVCEGTLTMEFDGVIIQLNIFDAMKYLNESDSLCVLSIIEPVVQKNFELDCRNKLEDKFKQNLQGGDKGSH